MFDSREDGATWLRRFSPYEREHSRLVKVRDSFVKVVEDLGLHADFVSYEQIESGELIRQGYKVLLLPQSVAMSAAECRKIEAFARAGGVVVADNMAASMDEHGRRLPAGQLDELFGVRQTPGWKAAGDGGVVASRVSGAAPLLSFDGNLALTGAARRGTLPDAPMVVRNGSAFYLTWICIPTRNCGSHGRGAAAFIALFRAVFAAAGIEPPVKIQGAHDILVRRLEGKGVEYVTLSRNPKSEDVPAPLPDAVVRLHVTLPRRARVSQAGRDYGLVRELDLDLDPWKPALLEVRAPAR